MSFLHITDHVDDEENDWTYILLRDVLEIYKAIASDDTPSLRRCFVRAAFAFIEGNLNDFQREFVDDPDGFNLPSEYVSVLSEQRLAVNDRGKIRCIENNFIPLKAKARLLLIEIPSVLSWQAPTPEDVGWGHFCSAIELRDRLTHPKKSCDLDVRDAEMKLANSAYVWAMSAFTLMLQGITEARERNGRAYDKASATLQQYSNDKDLLAILTNRLEEERSGGEVSAELVDAYCKQVAVVRAAEKHMLFATE